MQNFEKVYFAELKMWKMFLLLSYQLNKCTIPQSARPPCLQASLCLAGGDSRPRLIFIIVLVVLRYFDLVSG